MLFRRFVSTALFTAASLSFGCGSGALGAHTIDPMDGNDTATVAASMLDGSLSDADLETYAGSLSKERQETLGTLVDAIADKRSSEGGAKLLFVCTHNSRRSQLAQAWATVAAHSRGLDDIEAFSGGTEVTAFHPNAIGALERAGLSVVRGDGSNPRVRVALASTDMNLECWSKRLDDDDNPSDDFIAVMTCDDADRACPSVSGASHRVALSYVDPKVSDGTDLVAATYDERSRQIAMEMAFVMSRVAETEEAES